MDANLTQFYQGVASGGARPLSLDEAIRLAQLNSPQTVSARGQVRASDAAIRTAFSNFLPTFGLSVGGNRTGGQNLQPSGELTQVRQPWNVSRSLNTSLEVFAKACCSAAIASKFIAIC